jgi:hypothetical protein
VAIPTFQAAGTSQESASAITLSWPTHATDDIGLLFVETETNNTATLSGAGAADWTELDASHQATTGGTETTRLTMFRARATSASMSDVTVDDSGNHQIGIIITYRGCITTGNPVDVDAGDSTSSDSTSLVVPGATTTVADCIVIAASSNGTDNPAADPQLDAADWANSDLSDVVAAGRVNEQTNRGTGGGIYSTDGGKATAGAYGTTTATWDNNTGMGRISVALKPPVAAEHVPPDLMHRSQMPVILTY